MCVSWTYGKCEEYKYYKKHIIYPDTNKDTSTDKFNGVSRQLSK